MSEPNARIEFPPIGSHWVDTTGEDGEIVVDDYHKGYVVASGPALLNGQAIIQPGWFGLRYREMVRVIKGMDFKYTRAGHLIHFAQHLLNINEPRRTDRFSPLSGVWPAQTDTNG